MSAIVDWIRPLLPVAIVASCSVGVLWLAHRLIMKGREDIGGEARLPRQLVMLSLTSLVMVILILALPISDSTRNELLSLFGLGLTGLVAFSSTTFVANAMAGLMLRTVKSFRPGDFVRAGEHFGRVTERGLFHTEIQTEDRDLVTIPNLFLVNNPIRVMRSSGTIVSSTLSLGYDVPNGQVEKLLLIAAEKAELEEPFMRIVELGNFSVTYRISGFLPDPKHHLTVRSRLNRCVLDTLHANKVEIVSPAFMTQRRLAADVHIVPPVPVATPASPGDVVEAVPEEVIFDKAEEAERVELNQRALRAELEEQEALYAAAEGAARRDIGLKIEALRTQLKAPADSNGEGRGNGVKSEKVNAPSS